MPLDGVALSAATDAEVALHALAGEQASARELVTRYQRPIYNLVHRMVQDSATAEDLTQDTFTKLFRGLHTFDPRQRFSAWALRIAHNTALDHLRRHRPALVPLDAPGPDDGPSLAERLPDRGALAPDRVAERRRLAAALDAALDRLRPEYRRVIVLRYHEDLDYDEIAQVLDLPLGTVKTFLHRARHALAKEMAAAGWGSRPPGPPL